MKTKYVTFTVIMMSCLLLSATLGFTAQKEGNCIQIYFDQGSHGSAAAEGKKYAGMAQEILAVSFPEVLVKILPVEHYKKGDLELCRANFYFGSIYDNELPRIFIEDYVNSSRKVAWMGYNVWQMGRRLEQIFGYRYVGMTTLNRKQRDPRNLPSYFRDVHYRNRVFRKASWLSEKDASIVIGSFDQVELLLMEENKSQVLAESQNSGTRERIPYILRAQDRFYMADLPFKGFHKEDGAVLFKEFALNILR